LLEHTFIHVQGIGLRTERKLWEHGILTWDHFLAHGENIFSPKKDEWVKQELEASIAHQEEIHFFQQRLPSPEMWRLFPSFVERAVYLDIETSGGYLGVDEITVIGLYDGHTVQSFVNGINLDDFEMAIAPYELVITYNGSRFDLPFIRRWFKGVALPPAHIDLCFLLKRLGFKGGLKEIEGQVGIPREAEIEGMNGYDAVLLWKAYQWGDQDSLERLILYNTADIINLKPLMEMAYRELKIKLMPPMGHPRPL
jgi:uncharacterized protein YprB with RNaseH-like and TPR domain